LQVVVDAAVRQRAFVVAYDCEQSTLIGKACEQHADELLGLQVMESDIAEAGLRLFTTRVRASHEYICGSLGTVVSKAEFDSLPNSYGVEISRGRVVGDVLHGRVRTPRQRREGQEQQLLAADGGEVR
jgi:hypothetical protein